MERSSGLLRIDSTSHLHHPDFMLADLPRDVPLKKSRADLTTEGWSVDDLELTEQLREHNEDILERSKRTLTTQFTTNLFSASGYGAGWATGMLTGSAVGLGGIVGMAVGIYGAEQLTGLPISETINNYSPDAIVHAAASAGEAVSWVTSSVTQYLPEPTSQRINSLVGTYYSQLVGILTGYDLGKFMANKFAPSWSAQAGSWGNKIGAGVSYPLLRVQDHIPISLPKPNFSLPRFFRRHQASE